MINSDAHHCHRPSPSQYIYRIGGGVDGDVLAFPSAPPKGTIIFKVNYLRRCQPPSITATVVSYVAPLNPSLRPVPGFLVGSHLFDDCFRREERGFRFSDNVLAARDEALAFWAIVLDATAVRRNGNVWTRRSWHRLLDELSAWDDALFLLFVHQAMFWQ